MFMFAYGYDYMFPSLKSLLLYIQFLANSYISITLVKNYLSGAKTFLMRCGGDHAVLSAPLVVTVLKGIARLSTHVPTPAAPLSRKDLLRVCGILRGMGPDSRVAMAAILFGVTTFLRQCNFLPGGQTRWSPHLIRRADVALQRGNIVVTVHVHSTKTRQVSKGPLTLLIAPALGGAVCPVAACLWAWRVVPAPNHAPLFLLPSTGALLTGPALLSILRGVLEALRYLDPRGVTIHSLRRSGALLAARRGIPDAVVMAHGSWTSGAYRAYVPKPASSTVPAAIAAAWH